MSAPTTAAAVANAFLDIQSEDRGTFSPIDQMKLYKLVYYAHAWWLAQKGENLFDEDVHAWPWGPVVPSLYSSFKNAGRGAISGLRATELVKSGGSFLDWRFREPEPPDPEVVKFLRNVWDTHKGLSGVQLSNATHAPGEPWAIVKGSFNDDLSSKPHIPNSIIKSVFRKKLEDQHARRAAG